MRKTIRILDNIGEWTGKIVSYVLIILTILVVLEVIMRRFLGHPTSWNFEVTKQLFAFHFMMISAYALLRGSHVSIDFLLIRMSERKKASLSLISYLVFFFPFCVTLLWRGTVYSLRSWSVWETSWSVFAAPLYPIKTIIPLMALLLLLQGLSICIKNIFVLRGKRI